MERGGGGWLRRHSNRDAVGAKFKGVEFKDIHDNFWLYLCRRYIWSVLWRAITRQEVIIFRPCDFLIQNNRRNGRRCRLGINERRVEKAEGMVMKAQQRREYRQ